MAKDKIYGIIILLIGIIIAIGYTLMGPVSLYYALNESGGNLHQPGPFQIFGINPFVWQWALMLPIYIIVIVICVIAIWIGYSMITTPPPVPLEELEEELEAEESKSE
jgi:uncharacterized membrane protein